MVRVSVLAGAAVLALALILPKQLPAQPAADGDKIIIKFSHVTSADSPKGKAAEFFKKLAAERTNGRVQVEVYPNSQLYKDKEELEALELGSVQMLAPAFGKFGPMGLKEFEVLDLPFLFDDIKSAQKITQGPIGRSLLEKLSQRGAAGLAFWDNAFRQFTANKPLRRTEDFFGLKMRIQSSKVIDAQIRALGASPQVMGFGEIYQALQTGVIDGQDNPFTNIYTQKFYEIQKVVTVSSHGYHGYVLIANKAFWDGLPKDIRIAMDQVVIETTKYFNDTAQKDEIQALENIRKTGKVEVVTLTPEERQALKTATLPVYESMKQRVGADLLAAIEASIR